MKRFFAFTVAAMLAGQAWAYIDGSVRITTSTSNYGIVTGAGIYKIGDTVTLVAIPNPQCLFNGWNDGNNDNPRHIVASRDANFTAYFNNPSVMTSMFKYQNGEPVRKTDYDYDKNGYQIFEASYNWNAETNSWVVNDKTEYTYDTNGNRTLVAWYYWNAETNTWVNYGSNKTEYAYDENGNAILISDYNEKTEYAYDANGNKTLETYYRWNAETNSWIGSYKYEYAYDANGNKTLEAYYRWNAETNSWTGSSKNEYSYDENGYKIVEDYNWNSVNNSWSLTNKYKEKTIHYDEDRSLHFCYKWDTTRNEWIVRIGSPVWEDSYVSYYYRGRTSADPNVDIVEFDGTTGQTGSFVEYFHNEKDEVYMEVGYRSFNVYKNIKAYDYKIEFSFDEKGEKTFETKYVWDTTNNVWVGSYRDEYVYDSMGSELFELHYNWDASSLAWVGDYGIYYEKDKYGVSYTLIPISWNTDENKWNPVYNGWGTTYGDEFWEYTYDDKNRLILKVPCCYDVNLRKMIPYSSGNKYEYAYDSIGNKTVNSYTNWSDETNTWKYKSEDTYDTNGNITLTIGYNWDAETNTWISSNKAEYAYDEKGNKILATYPVMVYSTTITADTTIHFSAWRNSTKYEYAYDENGNDTLLTKYKWDIATDLWEVVEKYKYEYTPFSPEYSIYSWNDSCQEWCFNSIIGKALTGDKVESTITGNTYSCISYNYTNGAYINNKKVEYVYDSVGHNIILELYYKWDNTALAWVADYGYYKTGDYSRTHISWNTDENKWSLTYFSKETYNDENQLILSIEYLYDANNLETILQGKSEYVYDSAGNMILKLYYKWDTTSLDWVGDYGYWKGSKRFRWNKYDSKWNTINIGDVSEYDSIGNKTRILSKVYDPNIKQERVTSENRYTYAIINTEKNQSGNENQGGNQQGNQNGNENQGGENNNQNGSGNQSGNENQGGNGNQNNENQENVANTGFSNGYKDGYSDGYSNGLAEGRGGTGTATAKTGDADYNEGYNDGYKDGYKEGFKEGRASTTVVSESAAAAVNIYAYGNTIVVENAQDEIRIYDAMGRLFCREVECRVRTELQVNTAGVYIVKTGSVAKRVVIQ